MFEFEGDWFNASMVTAITCYEKTVFIYVHQREDSFEYDYNSEREAKEAAEIAAKSWRECVHGQPVT